MSLVEQQARSGWLKEMCLYTNEKMTENFRVYQKFGFEEEDRCMQDGYHRVFLRKRLG